MGFIYLVTNQINQKQYVGQTKRTIEIRWKEHIRKDDQTSLNKAIQKYGSENFAVTQLEECSDDLLNEREQYWITYYNTFKNGYNDTTGGQDCIMTTREEEVLELWNQGLTVNRIVETTKLNVETVRNYLNKNGINHDIIKTRANYFIGKAKSKAVLQFDLEGNFIKEWPSGMEAERQLGINHRNISAVACGKRYQTGGYIWKKKGDLENERNN